ncbi:MAG: Tab2/Atab2 family RNA-binding protein [Pseudanabaenaceae cyanobacterium SKYGB_i_bin29]|nr:Tab2/Atab2 family RNA-binding protein [Pseudanabaenaceae cyanobacterium SKYG29]MDW8422031.1 Tab2/Atab2 family RNA-binding protein [Pseudanabaenaceae cyanobacterium SKYGB_i_bin29]
MANPVRWELDFYSRPVLDENGRKIWELLICNPDRSFTYVQRCPPDTVNSAWLGQELSQLLQQTGVTPLKVRFFRSSMTNIITRGCQQAGLLPQASRRLFAMADWLQERMATVYPQESGFQAPDPNPLPLTPPGQIVPQPLPAALVADRWQVLSLPGAELQRAEEWDMDFGELFPCPLPPEQIIPGVLLVSPRATAIAAWMSGVDPVFLRFYPRNDRVQLRLDAGADSSWIVADIPDLEVAAQFETAKQEAGGVHFLCLQRTPAEEKLAGFWLLKQI